MDDFDVNKARVSAAERRDYLCHQVNGDEGLERHMTTRMYQLAQEKLRNFQNKTRDLS